MTCIPKGESNSRPKTTTLAFGAILAGLSLNNLITSSDAFQTHSTFTTRAGPRCFEPSASPRRHDRKENLSMHFSHSHSHSHGHSHELRRKPQHRQDRSNFSTAKVVNNSIKQRTSSRMVLMALVSLSYCLFAAKSNSSNSVALGLTVASWLTMSDGVVDVFDSIRRGTTSMCSDVDGVTYMGMIVNLLLSVSKAVVGLRCNSAVLVADAGHSLSDLLTDLLTLVFVRFGKYEAIGSLSISCILAGTGLSVGIASAKQLVAGFRNPATFALAATVSCVPALVVAGLSVASKEWLFRITKKVGEEAGSSVVVANAWHHRSDAFSSILALVSVGLAAAFPSLQFLDAAAGLLVAAVVGKAGVDIGADSVRSLFFKANRSNEEPAVAVPSEESTADDRTTVGSTWGLPETTYTVATWDPTMETYAVLKSLEESLALGAATTSVSRQMEVHALVKSFDDNVALAKDDDDAMLSSLPWLFDAEGKIIQDNDYITTSINDSGAQTWYASFLSPVESVETQP